MMVLYSGEGKLETYTGPFGSDPVNTITRSTGATLRTCWSRIAAVGVVQRLDDVIYRSEASHLPVTLSFSAKTIALE